ncbi:hypothetical protein G4O51_11795 [Candidatus Bathyarchaeota archaeon A05DMB-2]|jgi:hypothetical protein|nr:hypothetical protein [Candidatus Bathyarchaeota archaeon A05DMB-2]
MKERKRALLFLLIATISLFPAFNTDSGALTAASSGAVNPQKANVLWEKTYGGTGDDRAFYATTAGDGYLVVGSSSSLEQGKTFGWVLRLSHDGNVLWNCTYAEDADSEFRYALSLTDGFLLVGNMFQLSGDIDGYVVKIDDNGAMKWNVTVGGAEVDKLFSATKTQDGFMLVGLTYSFSSNESDVWVVKIDLNGNVAWNKNYGWSMDDAGRAIAQTEGNNFVVAGYTDSVGNGDYDFLMLKINAGGNIVWNKTYGGAQSDKAYAIVAASGGCVVAGDTRSKGAGDNDAWVIKVDLNGDLLWDRTVGGSGFDMPSRITCPSSGGYVLCGFTFSFGSGQRDFWLFKIDDLGSIQWSSTVGRSEYEEAYVVLETAENEFVMAGWTNSLGMGHYDYYVVKIDVTNRDNILLTFLFFALVLVAVASVLAVSFFLIRRQVNRRISKLNADTILMRSV